MRTAHIIIEPNAEVGTKTLAACGKEHKIKVLWADVSRETPICRDCIDVLLRAVNEANDHAANIDRIIIRAYTHAAALFDLSSRDNAMTTLEAAAMEYAENRQWKAEDKARKKAEKSARKDAKKCSCLWIADGQRVLQLDCPVHDHYGPGDEIAGSESEPLETRASTSDKAEEDDEQ